MAKSEKMSELVPGGVRTREGLVLRLVERQAGDCYERMPVFVEGRFWEVTLEEASGQTPTSNIQAPENNQAPSVQAPNQEGLDQAPTSNIQVPSEEAAGAERPALPVEAAPAEITESAGTEQQPGLEQGS